MTKKPNSLRHLDDAIRRVCGGSPDKFLETRTLMANALIGEIERASKSRAFSR